MRSSEYGGDEWVAYWEYTTLHIQDFSHVYSLFFKPPGLVCGCVVLCALSSLCFSYSRWPYSPFLVAHYARDRSCTCTLCTYMYVLHCRVQCVHSTGTCITYMYIHRALLDQGFVCLFSSFVLHCQILSGKGLWDSSLQPYRHVWRSLQAV